VKETPQPLVAGRVVRGIDSLVVLAEELLALSFGKVLSSNGQNCAQCRVTSMAIQDDQ
jgi:hypothetical protein